MPLPASCDAGGTSAFLRGLVTGKIAGGTPAPQNTSAIRNQIPKRKLRMHATYMAETHPRGMIPKGLRAKVHCAMTSMKTNACIRAIALFLGSLVILLPRPLAAQSRGNIEFSARVAPTGGQPEPVRQLTFYLLRKSLEDIRAEARQQAPAPDLDKFIDGLDVSPELKAWMKKHHSAQLSGADFTKSLTPEEILDIPEFLKAYMAHNAAFRGLGFPEPKFKEKDRTANPEKYNDQKDEYEAAIRKFIAHSPDTVQGMDVELITMNPYPKWETLESQQRQRLDASAFRLAQERYLVAHTDTDLDGHGSFASVAPGNYWIGMLGTEAISGDVRLHWDFPVTVRRDETARVELSNLNAARPSIEAQNSNN